jgi:hypothetical protein
MDPTNHNTTNLTTTNATTTTHQTTTNSLSYPATADRRRARPDGVVRRPQEAAQEQRGGKVCLPAQAVPGEPLLAVWGSSVHTKATWGG